MAKILDGKAVAAEVRAQVAAQVAELRENGVPVQLDVVLVGEDPASVTYVASKQRDCGEVGIESRVHRYPEEVSQKELAALMVTDIIEGGTELLCAGDCAPVERAFDSSAKNGVIDLPGVMSRKKQVAPKLLAVI